MPLSPGLRIGPYEIVAQIGAGGMGEVYRARDTKLGRNVALKILPEAFAQDADRLARFHREAEVLASLNHPNIAQIYGIEDSAPSIGSARGGTYALIMELVEGPTLADRIARGPLPVDEALPIARQIAEALEAAHDHGVIHRDLKPLNIKVRDDGTVKVLDFGLAKAMEPVGAATGTDIANSPTITSPALSTMGMIIGTAAYMSPEQARGRTVDKRTDIWAFGCVLYEMLTGRPAFGIGTDDVSATLADVIRGEPDWQALPGHVAPTVSAVLRACLKKDPRQRLHDIADARLALEGNLDPTLGADRPSATANRWWQRPGVVVLAVSAVAAGASAIAWNLRAPTDVHGTSRFEYRLPEDRTFRNAGRRVITVSTDGSKFAYNATGGLYVRRIDEFESHLIPGTEGTLQEPTFSPDGEWLAYHQSGHLVKIPVAGGRPVPLGQVANPFGLSWGPDGTILAGDADGIRQFFPNGETPVLILANTADQRFSHPQLLPGGEWVLVTVQEGNASRLDAYSRRSSERRTVLEEAVEGRYLSSGHLVYQRPEGGLFAVAFDASGHRPVGEHAPVLPELRNTTTGAGQYAVSEHGTLVYLSTTDIPSQLRRLVWVNRDGRTVEETAAVAPDLVTPALSPTGESVAYGGTVGNLSSVYKLTFRDGSRVLLSGSLPATRPVWSPDSKFVAFNNQGALIIAGADGTGEYTTLSSSSFTKNVGDWSRDNRLFLFDETRPRTTWDLLYLERTDDGAEWPAEARVFREETEWEVAPKLSPAGTYVAYVVYDHAGIRHVHVRSFPDGIRQWVVSINGGTRVRWLPSGDELYYVEGDWLVAVGFSADGPKPGRPSRLFQHRGLALAANDAAPYDVSPDGQRFLVIEPLEDAPTQSADRIFIVEHWFDELKRRLPAG